MKTILSKFIIFAAGAAAGSAVTWKLLDEKYKRVAREEIDSMKEYYGKKFDPKKFEPKKFEYEHAGEPIGKVEDVEESEDGVLFTVKSDKPNLREYAAKLQSEGYTDYATAVAKLEGNRPYVISPEEYGEYSYEEIELTYYADGVLADDMNNVVDDVDDIVGLDFADYFGEYEDDSVHIRNDRLKCDYEILQDSRNYSDVIKYSPHPAEDE